jgi:hypothetical protein
MAKKIIIGTLFVAFAGALIAGAVIRTTNKTARSAEEDGLARTNRLSEAEVRGGRGQSELGGEERGQSGRQGGGYGREGQLNAKDHSVINEQQSLQGSVLEATSDVLSIKSEDGEIVLVEGRSWSFAQESGFLAQEGDDVLLGGFYEDGEFKISYIENISSGQSVVLRGETGRPGWAGGGGKRGSLGGL